MITYELAKELKNAGFPQMMPDIDRFGNRRYINPTGEIMNAVFTPTLEELIEACGKCNLKLEDTLKGWRAKAYGSKLGWFNGPSPEIAVARLWLALNKK